jgi:predicted amidohydrolase YtcJ
MSPGPARDLLLHGGKVITLDRGSRLAEAVTVRDGRIVAVGASASLLKEASPATRSIDLRGRSVLPGFLDAHPHVDREGLRARGGISLEGLTSVAEIVEEVRRAASGARPGEWIVTMPMGAPPHDFLSRPDQLREGRFPTRQDLDAVAPDNPVYIRAVWGWWSHRPFPSVANSLALRLAGITSSTPAPYNCEIVKDAQGDPTGVFLERNFVPILEYTLFACLPRFTYEDRVESVRVGTHAYLASGTTCAFEGHGLAPSVIRAYREAHERGELRLRVHAHASVPSNVLDDRALRDMLHHLSGTVGGRGLGDDWLRVEGINLGGASDARVAEIVARGYPYDQWAGHFNQAMPQARFTEMCREAARLSLRVGCVVSRDLDYALSAYEAADRERSIRDRRWVLIHVNSATREQLARMKALGVVVTTVPGFLYLAGDRYGLDQLGERGVPLRALLDAGIPVALGTDGVPISMLWTVWEALARMDGDTHQRHGESHLTREEALRLGTQTGHWVTWNEDRYGTLEPGRMADMVVLDGDPLTCPEDDLKDLPVDMTIVGGTVAFERVDSRGISDGARGAGGAP